MFNQDVIAAVVAAKFCRVVIYPAVRGWCGERMQLEVADEIDALGHTDQQRGAGHWLVQSTTPRSKWRRRLLGWAKYSSNQVIDGKQVWHYRIELPPTTEAVAAKAVAA